MKGSKSSVLPIVGTEVIASYSRQQAIDNGLLIDVSKTAQEAGIRFPVALTHAVWLGYVTVPDGVEGQDEEGRLWDILWMTRCSLLRSPHKSEVPVWLYVRNDNQSDSLTMLKAIISPGDQGEPVITIMMRCED